MADLQNLQPKKEFPELQEIRGSELEIPFTLLDPRYGRAEFTICPVWKRRKLVELHIEPRQQPHAEYRYVIECGRADGFMVHSVSEIQAEPKIWMITPCAKHKSVTLWMYPPTGSDRLIVYCLSTVTIWCSNKSFGK